MAARRRALADRRRAELGAALRWPPDSGKARLLAAVVLTLCAAYAAVFAGITLGRLRTDPIGDFFGLWSAARLLADDPAAQVYDPAALKAAQVALGMDAGVSYPFPYPPSFLLALWPLGLLPLLSAQAVATGLTLVLFVWARVGRDWRSWMTVAALVAPTTTITAVAGQAGFLAAALLVGGFRLAAERPVLAGVLFGLATYKPQIGVLVPVALIAAGLWRTIAAACATTAALVLLTIVAFGPGVWPAWAGNMVQYAGQFAAESGGIVHLMPTVAAALLRLGAAPFVAEIVQLAAAAAVGAVVWRCFRAGPGRLAAAALFVATFVATPHAFVYDMPMVTTAVLWVIDERRRTGDAFRGGELLILLLAVAAPISLVAGAGRFPLALLSLVLLLGLIMRRLERARATANAAAHSGVALEPVRREG